MGLNPYEPTPFHISNEQFVPGKIIIGFPGTGKTTLMLNSIGQVARQGHGMFICLPGTPINDILGAIGPDHFKRCVIIDPDPPDCKPIGFKILDNDETVINELVRIVKNVSEYKQGGRSELFGVHMDEVLSKTLKLFAMLGLTLAHSHKALADQDYLDKAVPLIQDRTLRTFFDKTMPMRKKTNRESNTSVANRIDIFNERGVRDLFCQLSPTVEYGDLLDKISIAHLPYRKYDDDRISAVSGGLTLGFGTAIKHCIQKEANDNPFYFYLDEADKYFTTGMADFPAKYRKAGLRLVIGTQHLTLFNKQTQDTLLDCLPIKILYKLGGDDAKRMENEFHVMQHDLQSISKHFFYSRVGDKTYHLKGLKPIEPATDEQVMQVRQQTSREFGGTPVDLNDPSYFDAIFNPSKPRSDNWPDRKISQLHGRQSK